MWVVNKTAYCRIVLGAAAAADVTAAFHAAFHAAYNYTITSAECHRIEHPVSELVVPAKELTAQIVTIAAGLCSLLINHMLVAEEGGYSNSRFLWRCLRRSTRRAVVYRLESPNKNKIQTEKQNNEIELTLSIISPGGHHEILRNRRLRTNRRNTVNAV